MTFSREQLVNDLLLRAACKWPSSPKKATIREKSLTKIESCKKKGEKIIKTEGNGSKTFITNGWLSDLVIVVAITNPTAKKAAHGISLFLIEDGMEGFNKGKILKKVGLKGKRK